MTITLYDLPCTSKDVAWNPNTLKVRIALNYKGLPFKTEWLEYPDIEPSLKKISVAPTSKKADGRGHYTLPAIHDLTTGRVIAESADIVAYLDETYPDTAPLFPKGTNAAIALLEESFLQIVATHFFPIVLPEVVGFLNPVSSAYFRQTREKAFGKKMEELAPAGSSKHNECWTGIKKGLTHIANLYDKNGPRKPYFLGDTFTYADVIFIAFHSSFKIIMGSDSDNWKTVANLNDGRWGKLVDGSKKLYTIQ